MKRTLLAVSLAIATSAFADEGILVEAGPSIQQGLSPAGCVALYGDLAPYLRIEGGVMATSGGYIADVTPMLCAGQNKLPKLYGCLGVGLAYNAVKDPNQSQGAIFHDVLRLGYQMTDKVGVVMDATHYSNGGSYNPVFGTKNNGGMSYFMLGVTYKFH